VEASNEHGYRRTMKPDRVRKPIHLGAGSTPTPAFVESLEVPKPGAAGPDAKTKAKAEELLGGDGAIDWDAPP